MRFFKNFGRLISLLSAVLAISSCEEILDAEGLPYEEKLVIHGILYADSSSTIVQITRTLPLNIKFDTARAYITDANATISDGNTEFDLIYTGYGGKYYAKDLIPKEGNTYTLKVEWRELDVEATTVIPAGGSIDSARLETRMTDWGYSNHDLVAVTTLPEGTSVRPAYRGIMQDQQDWPMGGVGYGVFRRRDEGGKTITRLNIAGGSEDTQFEELTAIAYVFAPGYYEYFESRNADVDVNLGNPVLVKWNVKGDGIGIFFGCKKIEKRIF